MESSCLSACRRVQVCSSYVGISNYLRSQLLPIAIRNNGVVQRPQCRNGFSTARTVHSKTKRDLDSSHLLSNTLVTNSPLTAPGANPRRKKEDWQDTEDNRDDVKQEKGHVRDQLMNHEQLEIIDKFQQSTDKLVLPTDTWAAFDRIANSLIDKQNGKENVHVHGYITSIRHTKKVHFVQLIDPSMTRALQMVCVDEESPAGQRNWTQVLDSLKPHTPVVVSGQVVPQGSSSNTLPQGTVNHEKLDPYVGNISYTKHAELQVHSIQPLNEFSGKADSSYGQTFSPMERYMIYRTDDVARKRLRFRSDLKVEASRHLHSKKFQDVETPILFKSTPEGAREYVVPTRQKGFAYALPQSPQQYKQLLMASGVAKYFQFARCFRDEDFRTDRQPEFTQLDIEMAFADSKAVMSVIEELILKVVWPLADRQQRLSADLQAAIADPVRDWNGRELALSILTYEEAMSQYGSDKPDLRFDAQLVRAEEWIPSNMKGMLTSLEDPIIEVFHLGLQGHRPLESRHFITEFMKLGSSAQYSSNPDGMPGIAIYDGSAPLRGLASFGHEAADKVEERFEPETGDIIVVQARSRQRFSGGSTVIGRIRNRMHEFAVKKEILSAPVEDSLLWIVDFPLFSPVEQDSPGQGHAEICSTHHPFTAPKPGQDLSTLVSDPLGVVGDHFDLVVNGNEIGGGSRRIHHAAMQRLIFSEVLGMSPERTELFGHLLNALDAGCPPHAGFALGFDRLVAVLTDAGSVRNVIAFPKYANGEDLLVKAPSQFTKEQLETYHLRIINDVGKDKHGADMNKPSDN